MPTPENTDPMAPATEAKAHAVAPSLLEVLVCPVSKGPLKYDAGAQELISEQAGLAFPIRNGIPIMLADAARTLD